MAGPDRLVRRVPGFGSRPAAAVVVQTETARPDGVCSTPDGRKPGARRRKERLLKNVSSTLVKAAKGGLGRRRDGGGPDRPLGAGAANADSVNWDAVAA